MTLQFPRNADYRGPAHHRECEAEHAVNGQKTDLKFLLRQPHPALVKLDRAVEDILAKLKMPNLESYSQTQPLLDSIAQTTRENSRDPQPVPEQHDIAGAPMEGLYEATQLNTLRARLRGDPTAKSSRRKIESDLISQGLITLEEAEEMLQL